MGRNKGNTRAKGNTRPSSSGHSAGLLGKNGEQGFIGFNTSKSTQHVAQEGECYMDGVFSMAMKKMLKRDPTTRLKAIQDFKELCTERDDDTLVGVIPFWPRLYNKLALDIDRRIREVAQEANGKLFERVNRYMAPYLKSIMGVWLLGQCDLYLPAALAAQSAFTSAFSVEKHAGVLMFCHEEIFAFFKDNLFEQIPQSLRDDNCSDTDKENKHAFLVAGSLHGLKLFIGTISSVDRKSVFEDMKGIVSENKFWKFGKTKNFQVLTSWYHLISTLCYDLPEIFKGFEIILANSLFSHLSENNPIVALAVWEASLNFLSSFQDFWKQFDSNKVLFPKLWAVLKEGGQGNASTIYPCLLPLLSKIPAQVIEQCDSFHYTFFSCIVKSLFLEKVKVSKNECNSVVAAFIECLKYVFHHSTSDDGLIEKIFSDQLIWLIKQSFQSGGAHLPVSEFFIHLGTFIYALETAKNNASEKFQNIVSLFWKEVFIICKDVLNGSGDFHQFQLASLAYFFHCLHEAADSKDVNKHLQPSFSGEQSSNKSIASHLKENVKLQRKELYQLLVKVCSILCLELKKTFSEPYMKLLAEILSIINCCEMFLDVLMELGVSQISLNEAPLTFFQHEILNWLKNCTGTCQCIEVIVDVILVTCSHMKEDAAVEILNESCNANKPELQFEVLKRMVLIHKNDEVAMSFLESFEIGKAFMNLVNFSLLLENTNIDLPLHTYYGILHNLINSTGLRKIQIEELLKDINSSIKLCIGGIYCTNSNYSLLEFLCNVTESILSQKDYHIYDGIEDLMITLFELSLKQKVQNENITKKVAGQWKNYISQLILDEDRSVTDNKFISAVTSKLHNDLIHMESSILKNHPLEIILAVLSKFEMIFPKKSTVQYVEDPFFDCLDEILPNFEDWCCLKKDLKLSTLPSFLKKDFFYPFPACPSFSETSLPTLVIVADAVSELIMHYLESEYSDIQLLSFVKLIEQQLPFLIWASIYSKTVICSNEKKDFFLRLEEKCLVITLFVIKHGSFSLLNRLLELCVEDENQWILTLLNVVKVLQPTYKEELAALFDNKISEEAILQKELTSQIIIPHLSLNAKTQLFFQELFQAQSDCNQHYALAKICCCIKDDDVLKLEIIQNGITNFLEISFIQRATNESHENFIFSNQLAFILQKLFLHEPQILCERWNLVLEFLLTTLEDCKIISNSICTSPSKMIMAHQTFDLICDILKLSTEEPNSTATPYLYFKKEDLIQEISENIAQSYLAISDSFYSLEDPSTSEEVVLISLVEATQFLPPGLFLKKLISSSSDSDSETEKSVCSVLEKLLNFLTSRSYTLQVSTYNTLMRLMPSLPAVVWNKEADQEPGRKMKLLNPFVGFLQCNSEILENLVSGLRVSDSCIVLPYTDSYIYTFGYLCSWAVLLKFFESSTAEECSSYIQHLETWDLFSNLLSSVFCLMPDNPSRCYQDSKCLKKVAQGVSKNIFVTSPQLSHQDVPTSEDLQWIACNIYYSALRKAPASIRIWWNNLDKNDSDSVNLFTSKYISNLLSDEELQIVQECQLQFDNMTIRSRPASREVIATYTFDNSTIELTIKLPSNYPLGPVVIEKWGEVGISQSRWRHMLMQLTAFLTYQNGSIFDGILLWKRNLDKKFEGLEECLICYFILHTTTGRQPNLLCPTCKKKFHSDCLHKWFVTSNNSTCPLCRNIFVVR